MIICVLKTLMFGKRWYKSDSSNIKVKCNGVLNMRQRMYHVSILCRSTAACWGRRYFLLHEMMIKLKEFSHQEPLISSAINYVTKLSVIKIHFDQFKRGNINRYHLKYLRPSQPNNFHTKLHKRFILVDLAILIHMKNVA